MESFDVASSGNTLFVIFESGGGVNDPNFCFGSCGNYNWKNDQYCDDENNNCGCEWGNI